MHKQATNHERLACKLVQVKIFKEQEFVEGIRAWTNVEYPYSNV